MSWIEGYAANVRDDDGCVIGWVGTCVDFTAGKEVEVELARAGERFRAAFDNAPIGIALITPEGRWIEANRALCELLGYTEEGLRGLMIFDLTHPTTARTPRSAAAGSSPTRIRRGSPATRKASC